MTTIWIDAHLSPAIANLNGRQRKTTPYFIKSYTMLKLACYENSQ